jgi:DNA polymerase-3 subunit delta'
MIYPWQHDRWHQLTQAFETERLAHAYCITGYTGLGKRELAKSLAALVLCGAPAHGKPCGNCKACRLFVAGNHPDVVVLEPEGKMGIIKVEGVRKVGEFLHQSAQQGGYRVVIVVNAHAMNLSSSNALLKTLEEPGDNTLLVLTTDQPYALLPTIRSRCQNLECTATRAQTSVYLKEQGVEPSSIDALCTIAPEAPLYAKQLSEQGVLALYEVLEKQLPGAHFEVLDFAAQLGKFELHQVLDAIYAVLTRGVFKAEDRVAAAVSLQPFLEKWQATRSLANRKVSLNEQLLLEDLLVNYKECSPC